MDINSDTKDRTRRSKFRVIKKIFKQIVNIIMLLALFIVIQIPAMAEVFWMGEDTRSVNIMLHSIFVVVTTGIIGWLCIKMFKYFNGNTLNRRVTKKDVLIMLLFSIGSQVIQSVLTINDGSQVDTDILHAIHSPLVPVTIVSVVIISPFLEELLFQGMLQSGVLKEFSATFRVIITAVIFAFLHGYSLSLDTLALFFSGLAYALVFEVTSDIKMAIGTHAISNLIVLMLDLFF